MQVGSTNISEIVLSATSLVLWQQHVMNELSYSPQLLCPIGPPWKWSCPWSHELWNPIFKILFINMELVFVGTCFHVFVPTLTIRTGVFPCFFCFFTPTWPTNPKSCGESKLDKLRQHVTEGGVADKDLTFNQKFLRRGSWRVGVCGWNKHIH